jgi:DNA-binding NtrC family response regulator
MTSSMTSFYNKDRQSGARPVVHVERLVCAYDARMPVDSDWEQNVTRAKVANTLLEAPEDVELARLELLVESVAEKPSAAVVVIDQDVFRIGSHGSNDLVLEDPTVSRFHCRITRDEAGWRLTDNASKNGTKVGAVGVLDGRLEAECIIHLGDSRIRVRPLASTRQSVVDPGSFGAIVGASLRMRRLFSLLERVAASEIDVLITGESGTGKELIAAELIQRSARSEGPVVVVDCGAISPALIESELFGHVRGAFTGAERDREGALEAANGGTVLLDEIGELPLALQPKLLRALEAREVRRVGQTKGTRLDIRILAATHRDLEREVNRGRFREDLYYRLAKVNLRVPPLRERLEDVPALVRSFLAVAGRTNELRDGGLFSTEVLHELQSHEWPGNVRELRNHVERVLVLGETAPIEIAGVATIDNRDSESEHAAALPFRQAKEAAIANFERAYLGPLLERTGGNVSKAAREAQMDRMYLHQLAQRYGIPTTRRG